jgi:hypothetical protein
MLRWRSEAAKRLPTVNKRVINSQTLPEKMDVAIPNKADGAIQRCRDSGILPAISKNRQKLFQKFLTTGINPIDSIDLLELIVKLFKR